MGTAPGWYPDPNDETAEVYWDGSTWHGPAVKANASPSQSPPQPVPSPLFHPPRHEFSKADRR